MSTVGVLQAQEMCTGPESVLTVMVACCNNDTISMREVFPRRFMIFFFVKLLSIRSEKSCCLPSIKMQVRWYILVKLIMFCIAYIISMTQGFSDVIIKLEN